MKRRRDRAAGVLNRDGNLWVLGGRDDEEGEEGLSSSEVYEYQSKGNGKWKKGPKLPKDLPGGLESHCAVRYRQYFGNRLISIMFIYINLHFVQNWH